MLQATMNKTRFDLEQEILECWNITTDIKNIYTFLGNNNFFEDMDPKHQDKLMNLLLGIMELYEIKFDKTFHTFEECIKQNIV